MSDLFAGMEESLSPREKWCRENRVEVEFVVDREIWRAEEGGDKGFYAEGETREEAINKLAQRLFTEQGVKHWSMS